MASTMSLKERLRGIGITLFALHVPDWLFIILMLVLCEYLETNDPFYRMFYINDPRIQYPYSHKQRVSGQLCACIVIGVPLATILLCTLMMFGRRERIHLLHMSILALFTSLLLATFVTDVFKNMLGQPRPDFIDRCKPAAGTVGDKLVTVAVCTGKKSRIADGMRSMPSGHTTSSFAGLGFLTLWLCGQLQVLQPGVETFKFLIAVLPCIGAALIAISRTEDYRHGLLDITVGSIIGMSMCWFTYHKFFPSLHSYKSHIPYPPPKFYGGMVFHWAPHSSDRQYLYRRIESDIETYDQDPNLIN